MELHYWDTTRVGCDSLAVHVIYVHPTYLYHTPDTATCRYVPFRWENHENRLLYLVETGEWTDSIAVSRIGTFHYVDSLKTQTCSLCHDGGGCDSVWTLTLTVHPVGRFDSAYVVCSNDLITWQRRLYVGVDYDTLRWGAIAPATARYDSVIYLPDTIAYADTARYQNEFGCDVIYYLQLRKGHSPLTGFLTRHGLSVMTVGIIHRRSITPPTIRIIELTGRSSCLTRSTRR